MYPCSMSLPCYLSCDRNVTSITRDDWRMKSSKCRSSHLYPSIPPALVPYSTRSYFGWNGFRHLSLYLIYHIEFTTSTPITLHLLWLVTLHLLWLITLHPLWLITPLFVVPQVGSEDSVSCRVFRGHAALLRSQGNSRDHDRDLSTHSYELNILQTRTEQSGSCGTVPITIYLT